jgi:hypothetical protein
LETNAPGSLPVGSQSLSQDEYGKSSVRIAHERRLSEDLCSSFARRKHARNPPELTSPPCQGMAAAAFGSHCSKSSVGQGDEQAHGTNVPDKRHLKAIPEWLAAS